MGQISEHIFYQQYMIEFFDDENRCALKRLVEQYHKITDQHDRLLFDDPCDRSIMVRHARDVMQKLGEQASALGFTPTEWTRAVQSAADRLR